MTNKIDFPCPICSSTDFQVLHPDTLGAKTPRFNYNFTPEHNKTYRVVRCTECSHVYCSPRPEDIYLHYVDVVDDDYLGNREQRLLTSNKVLTTIRKHSAGGRLLDVGCATGDFIFAAKQFYQAEGLELSEWSARIAREKEFIIHQSKLDAMDPDEKYDIITMWGVIEHFEFPAEELAHINRLLKPNGIVCLWTGDIDSITSRLLGRKWWYYQGQHIQMFTQKSLEKVFVDNGFAKVEIKRYPYIMTLKSISKSLCRYPGLGRLATMLFGSGPLADLKITITLPGEMFAIFRKA